MNYYLHILTDTYNNGYFSLILDMLSYASIILAILVITTKNPVISVLFLIGLFFSIACYLISTGVTFIGISYLLVYVGAVSILFLFILMLINIRVSELITETKNSIPLVFLVGLVFEIAYYIILPQESLLHDSFISASLYILSIITYNNWENTLVEFNHVTSIGNIMYTNYSILLLLTSIILLLAMVGAIVITIKQKTTSYEEKITHINSYKSHSKNLPLQSNVSINLKELVNFVIKLIKSLTILCVKLFTICFFIFSGVIWYNYTSYIIYSNSYFGVILFYIIITLSLFVIYLMLVNINNQHKIKFKDRIWAIYRNKWLIMVIAVILVIPRNGIFALADVSIHDICYVPCVVFIVLATSIPVTLTVTLLINLYRKNSLKNSMLYASYTVKQMDYMYFFTLIIITCFVSIIKILIISIFFPLYLISNLDSIESVNTKDTFKICSPIEEGEAKGKGKRVYNSDSDEEEQPRGRKTKTSSFWLPRGRSVTPTNDPQEVAETLKIMKLRRDISPDRDPTQFYNMRGRIGTLSWAGIILGHSNIPCTASDWANRAPFHYISKKWPVVRDVNNNIIADIYNGEYRTIDGKRLGVKSVPGGYRYKEEQPDQFEYDGLHTNIDTTTNIVTVYHLPDHVIGVLCREGHVHNNDGVPIGVIHSRFVYHRFIRHHRMSRVCVPAGSSKFKPAIPPANLDINSLRKIEPGAHRPFYGYQLNTEGVWPEGIKTLTSRR